MKSFKKIAITLMAVTVLSFGVVLLAGCGESSSSSSSSTNANVGVGTDNVLTVGFDQDFPPYGYVDESTGGYTGFDLDLAKEVAARNGWAVEYKPINWDSKDLELDSGSIDCIWNGFTIEGREDGYSFTSPYMDNSQVVVVRQNSGISSLADLSGKNVMVQADSAALDLLSDGGDQANLASTFAKLQTTPEYNTAFMELESGAVDAVAIDLPVAKFNIQGKESTFKILDEQLNSEHYAVGAKKGNTSLCEQIEKSLKEMDKDGTIQTICNKYQSQGISYDMWILGK